MAPRTVKQVERPRARTRHVAALAVLLLCCAASASAQQASSESFRLTGAVSFGTGVAASPGFRLVGSLDPNGAAGLATGKSFLLVSGVVASFNVSRSDDNDGDSVTNGEESSVRGGDGNGDSIPDEVQSFVASLSGITTPLTAEVREGGCATISLARATPSASLAPSARFAFPHDLVRLKVTCASKGAESVVRFFYHSNSETRWPLDDFRVYGVRAPDFSGTASYFSIPLLESGLADMGGSRVPYVEVRLTDGMYGDATPEDGVLELTVGPASMQRPVRP